MAQQLSVGRYGYASGQHSNFYGTGQSRIGYGYGSSIECQFPDDFLATFDSISGLTTVLTSSNSPRTLTAIFTSVGNKFNDRIRSRARNFSWSKSSGTGNVSFSSTDGYQITVSATHTGSITIRCGFRDSFNSDTWIYKYITFDVFVTET